MDIESNIPPKENETEATRRVHAAAGYAELGLANEAEAELVALPDYLPTPALTRERCRLQAEIHRQRGEWETMRCVALACRQEWPEDSIWWTSLAYATRRCPPYLPDPTLELTHPELVPTVTGWSILKEAERRFPTEPAVLYNLADYCQALGWRYEAAGYLRRVVRLDARWWTTVLADRELAPLLGGLEPETWGANEKAPPPASEGQRRGNAPCENGLRNGYSSASSLPSSATPNTWRNSPSSWE